ncbi:hypothetical protein GCM10023083_77980 [Streptomyces phyllanthi]
MNIAGVPTLMADALCAGRKCRVECVSSDCVGSDCVWVRSCHASLTVRVTGG